MLMQCRNTVRALRRQSLALAVTCWAMGAPLTWLMLDDMHGGARIAAAGILGGLYAAVAWAVLIVRHDGKCAERKRKQ